VRNEVVHSVRQALEASEAKYRLLAENASDVVGELDREGHVLWGSPSMSTLYGWDLHLRPRLSLADFIDEVDLQLAYDTLQTIVERGVEQSVRLRTRSGDGTPHTMSALARPVKADGLHVSSVIVGLRDVTREVAAVSALAASEEHFRQIVEHINDVIAVVGPDRRIVWISPSVTPILGWRPDEVVGTVVSDLLVPEDEAKFGTSVDGDRGLPHFMSPGRPIVARIQASDGRFRWMSIDASPIRDDDGAFRSVVATLRDVEDLVRTTEELNDERTRLKVTLDSLLDPHVLLVPVRDVVGNVMDFTYGDVNSAASWYMKMSAEVLKGAGMRTLMPNQFESGMFALYVDALVSGRPLVLDDVAYDNELFGAVRHYDLRAVKVGDALSVTWRDVTGRHDFESQLNALATRDSLTGLTNRAELLEEIARSVDGARRNGGIVAIALLDLDHFKDVNDTLGHAAGDALLQSAAQRISGAVKQSDVVGRLGGDEFVVLVRDMSGVDDAVNCVERVLAALRDPFEVDGNTVYATGSVGLSVLSNDPTAIAGGAPLLLREADIALYEAKATGRNTWALFTDGLRAEVTERVSIGNELRLALARDELMVWYQPEIDLLTGRVRAVEALLRWNHPNGDVRAAETFIEIAEDSGLILEIGEWVIRTAFADARTIIAMRPTDPVTVRINLAAAQFSAGDLVQQIDAALAATGVDPGMICLEITESALVRDLALVRQNLETMRTRGLHFALDDFGAGYASLTYLRDFPVELIKIDRSFLVDTEHDDRTRRLVRAIVLLSEQLGIDVTAEGVETEEQAAFLRQIGCASAQGYLFAPAVPIPTLRPLIERGFGAPGTPSPQ
jgi:diguanylate cyclase (GGDEF)-like protein/PAS domain S-box-containing protein